METAVLYAVTYNYIENLYAQEGNYMKSIEDYIMAADKEICENIDDLEYKT